MRKLLILALFAMVACCVRAQTYHNCTTTITAASISCTFSFSAGDYWYMQTGGFVSGVIPPTGPEAGWLSRTLAVPLVSLKA